MLSSYFLYISYIADIDKQKLSVDSLKFLSSFHILLVWILVSIFRNLCCSSQIYNILIDKTFSHSGLCHKQQCAGYRHYSNSFRDSLRVRDVSECSDRCAETSYCKTFSFRHGVESSLELNCLLSSYSNFRLDATSDLLTDINWNLYRRIRNDQCGNSENDRQDYSYGRGNIVNFINS